MEFVRRMIKLLKILVPGPFCKESFYLVMVRCPSVKHMHGLFYACTYVMNTYPDAVFEMRKRPVSCFFFAS